MIAILNIKFLKSVICSTTIAYITMPPYRGAVGRTFPRASPKPMWQSPLLQEPLMMTSSPSMRNIRGSPSLSAFGLVPLQASSSMEPKESGV